LISYYTIAWHQNPEDHDECINYMIPLFTTSECGNETQPANDLDMFRKVALLTLVLSSIRLSRNLPSRSSMCQFSCTKSGFSSIPSRRSSAKCIHISSVQGAKWWKHFVLNTKWNLINLIISTLHKMVQDFIIRLTEI